MDDWVYQITHHTWIHENIKKFMDGFHHDAHPMGMLVSTVAALSTFYPEAREERSGDTGGCRSSVSSPRCRRWRPSRSGTAWACPTRIPTTA